MALKPPSPKKPAVKRTSSKVQAFVSESPIPGSVASELDEVEAKLEAEKQQRTILELRLNAVNDRIEKLTSQQQSLCPHHTTKDDSHYYGGSYNDRAETTHNLRCVRCGFSVKRWTVTHNWYG